MNFSIVVNESLYVCPFKMLSFCFLLPEWCSFFHPVLWHLSPILLRQDVRLGTPHLAGTPALVRSAPPPPPPTFQRWYILLGEGQMTPHVCISDSVYIPVMVNAGWRVFCNWTRTCRRVKQRYVPLKVSPVRGRLFRHRGVVLIGAD